MEWRNGKICKQVSNGFYGLASEYWFFKAKTVSNGVLRPGYDSFT